MTLPSRQHLVEHLDNTRPEDHGPKRKQTLGCVWHCTAGDRMDGAISHLAREDVTASYHYGIEKDGRILRLLDHRFTAYHAGRSRWASLPSKRNSLNHCTIGIAFANDNGSDGNDRDDELTEEQLASGLWLGVTMMEIYKYGASKNLGHIEVSPGRKFDPLPRILNMDQWRKTLAEWE